MHKVDILGVKVNPVSMEETVEIVEEWLKSNGKPFDGTQDKKHYIVTPNPEFIMAAQNDREFKEILNKADLAIPDSARLGWSVKVRSEKRLLKRALLLPFVVFPKLLTPVTSFPVTSGTDLVDRLCEQARDLGFTVGFLGGQQGVAAKTAECLSEKYPGLKVAFAEDGPLVDMEGESGIWNLESGRKIQNLKFKIPNSDILFVAFGQIKQEKWIAKSLDKLPVKVAIGVGGAFDYISGRVPRAPKFLRSLGFEWLFRLFIQPWRIKRQLALIKFIRGVLYD